MVNDVNIQGSLFADEQRRDTATARKIEAYEQAAKRAAVIVLELSEREKQIIAELE